MWWFRDIFTVWSVLYFPCLVCGMTWKAVTITDLSITLPSLTHRTQIHPGSISQPRALPCCHDSRMIDGFSGEWRGVAWGRDIFLVLKGRGDDNLVELEGWWVGVLGVDREWVSGLELFQGRLVTPSWGGEFGGVMGSGGVMSWSVFRDVWWPQLT